MITIDFKKLGISPGDRILDIGCGTGRHTDDCIRINDVVVIASDIHFETLTAARKRLEWIEGFPQYRGGKWGMTSADITALPFEDQCFDHVICSEVLEHVYDHHEAAKELIRVLKNGGHLAVSVPRYFPEKICWALSSAYHSVTGGHIRIYKKEELATLFENMGLRARHYHFAHSLHTPYWWLKCMVGLQHDNAFLIRLYHRFLVWDIMKKPKITRFLDKLLNPLLGKSLVIYLKKY